MSQKFAVVLLTLVFSAVAFAQSTAGMASISGVVQDPSGAAVPDAKEPVEPDLKRRGR